MTQRFLFHRDKRYYQRIVSKYLIKNLSAFWQKLKLINIMKSGKMFLGILAGFAGGALISLLFAPEKGSRTRRNMMILGDDYTDDLKDKFQEYTQTLAKKYEKRLCEVESMLKLGKTSNT